MGREEVRNGVHKAWPLILLAAVVVLVSFLGSLGPGSLDRTVVTMLINLILVVGLYVFVGNSGVFSFGHVGFVAIGAYAAAILVTPVETKELLFSTMPEFLRSAHLSTIPATLVAGVVAASVALVLAGPLMRLSGLTAALSTFGFLIIVNVVANNWKEVTNASSGIVDIPQTTTISNGLVWVLIAMLAAFLFQQTSSCLRLRASREDEVAARAVGVNVARERGVAFCLSAFLLGVGGALFAQSLGAISPDVFYFTTTFFTLAVLIVGGVTSLSGAVIGTLVLSALSEVLRRFEQGLDLGAFTVQSPTGLQQVGFAVVMLAILIGRPRGITGGREITWPLSARPPWQEEGKPGRPDNRVTNSSERLEAHGVRVHFEGVKAVDDVDLVVDRGEILGLIGPNGAGKTTLVNVLSGFQRPTAGTVWLAGVDVTGRPPFRLARRGLTRTFQNLRLFDDLTVFENVEVGAVASGLSHKEARKRSVELLNIMKLADRATERASALPQGEERRLGIARALATGPKFVLLDEPAAGLNELESDELMATIVAFRDMLGCGVLVIEHDMRVIMGLSERIQVLDYGKTISIGTPSEVRSNPAVIAAYLGSKRAQARAED